MRPASAAENWSLLATRSLLWNDRISRTTTFLTVLSAAVVALALVANATGLGPTTRTVALGLLPVVLLIGLAPSCAWWRSATRTCGWCWR
jgi:hypothetical protein